MSSKPSSGRRRSSVIDFLGDIMAVKKMPDIRQEKSPTVPKKELPGAGPPSVRRHSLLITCGAEEIPTVTVPRGRAGSICVPAVNVNFGSGNTSKSMDRRLSAADIATIKDRDTNENPMKNGAIVEESDEEIEEYVPRNKK